jgi:phosphoribosylanthranilate isomerase
MMKLVKICGMREPTNIIEVANLQPHFLGFIFYKPSARYVGDRFNMPAIPKGIKKVGVFVNETTEVMVQKANDYQLDFLQLHGEEPVEQVMELKTLGFKIIKAFRINDLFGFSTTDAYQPYCDFFLFDSKGKNYGGNNQVFDWSVLKNYNQKIPFLLSGGLNASNLQNTTELNSANCVGFDINSGAELSPAVKDVDAVKRIIQLINCDETHSVGLIN